MAEAGLPAHARPCEEGLQSRCARTVRHFVGARAALRARGTVLARQFATTTTAAFEANSPTVRRLPAACSPPSLSLRPFCSFPPRYDALPEAEKNKDRHIIYMGIRAQYDLRLKKMLGNAAPQRSGAAARHGIGSPRDSATSSPRTPMSPLVSPSGRSAPWLRGARSPLSAGPTPTTMPAPSGAVRPTRMVHVRRAIASELHEAWRAPRRQKQQQRDIKHDALAGDGAAARTPAYLPRWKVVDGKTLDIANLDFELLPKSLQTSNLSAAHCACSAVERAVRESTAEGGDSLAGETFMESAAAELHANWMEHNREWADAELLVPYAELTDAIKEKDRSIVRIAIRRFRAYTRTVFGFIPPHVRRMPFFHFERELARYCEALRQNGHLGAEADLLEIQSTELLLCNRNAALAQGSASSAAGWNIVAAACTAMRSAIAPFGPETLLIDPSAATASRHEGGEEDGPEPRRRASVTEVATARAAVEIGSELAHTARIAKNVDLCISVANEVILLCGLLPFKVLAKNATLQVSLAEAYVEPFCFLQVEPAEE